MVGHGRPGLSGGASQDRPLLFGFMSSECLQREAKGREPAGGRSDPSHEAEGKKVLLVGGPAIVHTGSSVHAAQLIRDGWVQVLFAGNGQGHLTTLNRPLAGPAWAFH